MAPAPRRRGAGARSVASRTSAVKKGPLLEQHYKDEAEKHARYSILICIFCVGVANMGENARMALTT